MRKWHTIFLFFYKFYDKVLGKGTLLELVEKIMKKFWLKSVRVQFFEKKNP